MALQLAPISWFSHVAADPPSIMISIVKGNRPSGRKDTSDNILELREFCVSLISEPFVEAANYAAIDAPEGQSEWPLTGLTQRESR
jgi:flavin reductase (DIM6/NTAB) family NADH-FMN oxidoreductase RutF